MEKKFFIFIGRSGGGKGTQALLLKSYLESKGHTDVTHITTGGSFRDFIEQDNHIARLAKDINDKGALQPEFLAVWIWSNIFITKLKGVETILLDGAPRRLFESEVLHSAIHFLGYAKPTVIYLDVSESVSREHVKSRGRVDDSEEDMSNKMNWFETDILPILDAYRNDPRYHLLHVNGNQPIEDVHKEIVAKYEEVAAL